MQQVVDSLQCMQQQQNQLIVAQLQAQQQSQQIFITLLQKLNKKWLKKTLPVKSGSKKFIFSFSMYVFCVYLFKTKHMQFIYFLWLEITSQLPYFA